MLDFQISLKTGWALAPKPERWNFPKKISGVKIESAKTTIAMKDLNKYDCIITKNCMVVLLP